MKKRINLPSPAAAVAVLALVVAVAGVSYASTKIGANQIKSNAVKTSKIADGAVTEAKIGDGAVTAAKLGGPAPTANGLTVIAAVNADGTLTTEQTRNVASTNVSHPGSGVYCFDLPFLPLGAQATVEANGSAASASDSIASVAVPPHQALTNCPATTEVEVITYETGTNTASDEGFYIEIYN